MTVSVRRWTRADLPAIQRLLLETWLDAYGSFIPRADLAGYLHTQYSQAKLEALLADQDVTGLVAEGDAGVGQAPEGVPHLGGQFPRMIRVDAHEERMKIFQHRT